MALVSLCIVGKNNEPLYLREFRDEVQPQPQTQQQQQQRTQQQKTQQKNQQQQLQSYANREDVIPEAELFGLTVSDSTSTSNTPRSDKTKPSDGMDGFSTIHPNDCCSLKQQFILHAALDRFEELAGPMPPGYGWREPGSYGHAAMWLGLLCPVDDILRVYGYQTTTLLKFMAVIEDTGSSSTTTSSSSTQSLQNKLMEEEVKQLLIKIHGLVVEYTLNPFNKIGDAQISSKRFDKGIADCVSQFNRTF